MAHEYESGFLVGKPAWHGLGTVVGDAPSIADAIKLAGLDWEVELRELAYITPGQSLLNEAPQAKAVVRTSDGRCLGVVGNSFRPLQNVEAFNFFEPFVSQGFCDLETAGSLRNGQRIWVLAKLKGMIADVAKDDAVEAYLLLSNAHDGSAAVRCQFTPVRVVCMNTLSKAEERGDNGADKMLKVMHNPRIKQCVAVIQRAVCIEQQTFAVTIEQYRMIAKKKLPIDGLKKYVTEVFGLDVNAKRPAPTLLAIEQAYHEAPGQDTHSTRGTYWGAYNAVTWWIDRKRGKNTSSDMRLDSTWFGEGRNIRNKAFEVALKQ